MVLHLRKDFQLGVGERADGEWRLFGDQALDQHRVFYAAYAVVDTDDAQQIQRLPDVICGAFLASVSHRLQTLFARHIEYPYKALGRIAVLGTVEAYGNKVFAQGQGFLQSRDGFILAQVAQETENKPRADAQLGLPVSQCPANPLELGRDGNTALGVRLWIKEGLDMHHAIGCATLKIGPGQVVEILLGL